jgi:quinol monooxygenase YgiN
MTNNVYWVIKAEIVEGQLAALRAIAPKFCEMTKTEPGAIAYEWSLSADEKTVHIYERYEDSDAALAHLGNVGPHLPELMGVIILPTAIECYGAASDAFKEALKDFPMIYFDQFDGFGK